MLKPTKEMLSNLPPLYAGWMLDLLGGPIPDETEVNCQDCVMCNRNGKNKSEILFNPDTKCCTYNPHLPNFLVGRILEENDPESQQRKAALESQFLKGCFVAPLGVDPPRWYSALYKEESAESFGIDV